MINFTKNLTKARALTLNNISLSREKIKIRLTLKDITKELVVILTNIFYFSNNLSKFVSLDLLNDIRIYYHNEY